MGDGWHRIQSVQPSSKSLDVEGNYSISGTNVIVWGNHDGDNQRWRFIPDGSGFRIQSKLGFYLDVSGGSSDDETNVQVWDGNGPLLNSGNYTKPVMGDHTAHIGLYESISPVSLRRSHAVGVFD